MRIMVPLADGFEEIEAFSVIDILRRAGVEVDTVGVMGTVITGAHDSRVMIDKKIIEINPEDYDGIVLPGGDPGYLNLGRSAKLLEIIKEFSYKDKIIAAICAAPTILSKLGLLDGKKATIYPGMEKELPYPRGEKVVVDGNIITSQGPGTAIEFALKIAEKLVGKEKAFMIRKDLVV